uniref:Uncharacterized protein n=1 Tax=Rhizophora mucronata TaxID=61149 RepID=A0A2P2JA65_RHIMU
MTSKNKSNKFEAMKIFKNQEKRKMKDFRGTYS